MKIINHLDQAIRTDILEHHPFFSTKIDQYLKWAPLASILCLDALGVQTRNKWKDHLIIVSGSYTLSNGAVQGLKKITKEIRPNFSPKENSFPSAHTATCFLGAEILHQELKDNYPIAGYLGYGLATTTGILRLYKNKHWLSDVVCGAALGILTVKIVYSLFKKTRNKQN
ncbi:MAG TPA: phosphatase PAP2 family protein [Flavisolibacter sp.]|jgi:membrane-associated phospholipid phosphatase|nr:phosphatase PAP2 family protein [Flavisolibacter sp.]